MSKLPTSYKYRTSYMECTVLILHIKHENQTSELDPTTDGDFLQDHLSGTTFKESALENSS
eukprot:1822754-Ditylum_brightwellii.AAC.1